MEVIRDFREKENTSGGTLWDVAEAEATTLEQVGVIFAHYLGMVLVAGVTFGKEILDLGVKIKIQIIIGSLK